MHKLVWHRIKDDAPPEKLPLLISDGEEIGLACWDAGMKSWYGAGFDGYEWEWNFNPYYWATLEINLPVENDGVLL